MSKLLSSTHWKKDKMLYKNHHKKWWKNEEEKQMLLNIKNWPFFDVSPCFSLGAIYILLI